MSHKNPSLDFSPEEKELLGRLRLGSHPSPDLLRASAEDALPEEIKAEIRNHLHDCELCSTLQSDLSQLEPGEPSEKQRRRMRNNVPVSRRGVGRIWGSGPSRLLLVIGTTALLIALSALLVWPPRRVPAPRQAVGTAPAVPHPVNFAVEKAPIDIPAALLPTRGAQRTDLPSLQEWTLDLKPYQQGDFARAVAQLAPVTRKYPRFADGYFYLGVSQLMLQRNEDAAKTLKIALGLASGRRLLQVKWYLAAAEVRLGHTAEAVDEWRSICAAGSVFGKEACDEIQRGKSPGPH